MQRRQCEPPRVRPRRVTRGVLLAVAAMAGAVLSAPAVLACGYHSPQQMARGFLNWAYPDALHVDTAVWRAEKAGILPARRQQQPRDMFAYHKTVSRLQKLGTRLSAHGSTDDTPVGFSAVLIDTMLWVRFTPGPEGYAVLPHTDWPREGDTVMVTDGKVVAALAEDRLDATQAETHGLFRLYGQPGKKSGLRELLAKIRAAGLPAHATPSLR